MQPIRTKYQTVEFGEIDIHVQSLRDHQQYPGDDNSAHEFGISSATWPIFGVLWDSAHVLAHLMANFEIKNKRILEVGCGIALSSLILNHRHANITATDHHPSARQFLSDNTNLNNDNAIPFTRTGWADDITDLGEFDLVIGSDLLYEKSHINELSSFINQHSEQECEVILIDPGRGQHAQFSKRMVEFGFDHSQCTPKHTNYLDKPFKGQILTYTR